MRNGVSTSPKSWLLLTLVLLASPAWAGVYFGSSNIQVIPPEEVAQTYLEHAPDGTVLFRDAWGGRVRVITETSDPEIANPGDGQFHPAQVSEVMDALAEIPQEFLRDLRVDIYLLPYPRSGMLSSSADGRAIYLTPGVLPYEEWQVHFLVAHEVGHLVHRRWLPDSDRAGWQRWAALRGTTDATRFSASAPHAWRPREIFAEDFRVLFGGPLARGDGSVENPVLSRAEDTPGLAEFYRGLVGPGHETLASATWRVAPNPVRPGDGLLLEGPADLPAAGWSAALYDIGGRRVMELMPEVSGNGTFRFLPTGRDLSPGAYWLRITGSVNAVVPLRVIH